MFFSSACSGKRSFPRISKKSRGGLCVFFEAERVKVLEKTFSSPKRGTAGDTPVENLRMGNKQKFIAGLYAVVEFAGMPENRLRINGSLYVKIKVATTEGDVYCYSQIDEEKYLCLEIVSE
jgi:hypothetical protein